MLAAVTEIATGLALLIVPEIVGQLLFGVELTIVAIAVAGVTGIALIGLGVNCWLGTPLTGMLIYNAVVTLYLAYLGMSARVSGVLLWPVVGVHLIFTILLLRVAANDRPAT